MAIVKAVKEGQTITNAAPTMKIATPSSIPVFRPRWSANGVMKRLKAPLMERTVIAREMDTRSTPRPLAKVLRKGYTIRVLMLMIMRTMANRTTWKRMGRMDLVSIKLDVGGDAIVIWHPLAA